MHAKRVENGGIAAMLKEGAEGAAQCDGKALADRSAINPILFLSSAAVYWWTRCTVGRSRAEESDWNSLRRVRTLTYVSILGRRLW